MKLLSLTELRAKCADLGLTTFRDVPLAAPRATASEFGWSPMILDRVSAEHSATICERIERARRKAGAEDRRTI